MQLNEVRSEMNAALPQTGQSTEEHQKLRLELQEKNGDLERLHSELAIAQSELNSVVAQVSVRRLYLTPLYDYRTCTHHLGRSVPLFSFTEPY